MAVLGAGGKLLLKRQAPEPCLINPESVDPEGDIIFSICDGYWTGDHISSDCLPYSDGKFPPGPSGYATYFGSKFFLGPNRDQITSNRDQFYKTDLEDYQMVNLGKIPSSIVVLVMFRTGKKLSTADRVTFGFTLTP